METYSLPSLKNPSTISTSSLVCSSLGTSFVSTKMPILNSLLLCLARAVLVVSGLVSGLWVTWDDPGMVLLLKECGREYPAGSSSDCD